MERYPPNFENRYLRNQIGQEWFDIPFQTNTANCKLMIVIFTAHFQCIISSFLPGSMDDDTFPSNLFHQLGGCLNRFVFNCFEISFVGDRTASEFNDHFHITLVRHEILTNSWSDRRRSLFQSLALKWSCAKNGIRDRGIVWENIFRDTGYLRFLQGYKEGDVAALIRSHVIGSAARCYTTDVKNSKFGISSVSRFGIHWSSIRGFMPIRNSGSIPAPPSPQTPNNTWSLCWICPCKCLSKHQSRFLTFEMILPRAGTVRMWGRT